MIARWKTKGPLFLFISFASFVWLYGMGKLYGPMRFPDEFGYWSHGANILGYNWRETVSLHPYYSFGYGLLMSPLMRLIRDPVLLYRTAVSVNLFLLFLCVLVLGHIGKMMMEASDMSAQAVLAMLYSSFFVYAQTSLPETLLTFLHLALLLKLMEFQKKPSVCGSIWLSGLSGALFFAHMRTIGIGAALWILLLIGGKRNRKARFCILLGIAFYILLLLTACLYKNQFMAEIYGGNNGALASVNDFNGQIAKLGGLCSLKGLLAFTGSLGGKMFYLGSATGGLVYWGILFMVRQIKRSFCADRTKGLVYGFVLLSFLFTLGIVSVFMIDTTRVDGVLYGRYTEMLLPVFLMAGLWEMEHGEKLWKRTFEILCVQSLLMFLVNWVIETEAIRGIYRHSIPAISYALEYSDSHIFTFTKNVYLGGGLQGLLLACFVWLGSKTGRRFFVALWGIFQCVLGLWVCTQMNYHYNAVNHTDIMAAKQIGAWELNGRDVYYLYTKGYGYVDLLQYCLMGIPVHVRQEMPYAPEKALDYLGKEDIVVTSRGSLLEPDLKMRYEDRMESEHFDIYFTNSRQEEGRQRE